MAICAVMVVFVTLPRLAHALGLRELRAHSSIHAAGPHDEIVMGGRRMSGFLVVPDGGSGPRSVPSMGASEFARIVRATRLEADFGAFLDQVLRRVPFAFVGAARIDGANNTNTYIASPDVLARNDVWAWRFTTRSWSEGEKPWSGLREVVAAEPLP